QRVIRLRRDLLEVVEQRGEFGRHFLYIRQAGGYFGLDIVQQPIHVVERSVQLRSGFGKQLVGVGERVRNRRPITVVQQMVGTCQRDLQAVQAVVDVQQRVLHIGKHRLYALAKLRQPEHLDGRNIGADR